jgi:hypothetical protein
MEEINSLTVTITGLRAGKGVLSQFAVEYKKSILKIIDEAPTAYDVDKVVEQLEKKMFTADLYEHGWDGQTVDNLLCYGDIYDILKGGLEKCV